MFPMRLALAAGFVGLSTFVNAQYGPKEFGFDFGRLAPGSSTVALTDSSFTTFLDAARNEAARTYAEAPRQQSNPKAEKALATAEQLYFQRGGYYQFGPNDCSTFVCDFLQNYTQCVSRRVTTGTLYDSEFMNHRGFVQLSSPFRDLQPYDILVYRYFDTDFMSQGGHCGILVWKEGKMCVEHNSSSNKGLAVTPVTEFYRKLVGRNELQAPKIFRWMGSAN